MENFDVKKLFKKTRNFSIEEKISWFTKFSNKNRRLRKFYLREIQSPSSNIVSIYDEESNKSKRMYMFGSNDYLGLGNDPRVKEKIESKLSKYGIGLGGAAVLNGYSSIHKLLEKKISAIKNKEDAMLFSGGYSANIGLISCLLYDNDLIIIDEYCHASLMDGIKLSNCTKIQFNHNDTYDLERILVKHHKKYKNIFIAFEGLYSMNGDSAPIDGIVKLAKKFGAYTILDDCHATGILGDFGSGMYKESDRLKSIDFVVGSFSKAYALSGGFICAKKKLIYYLRIFSRTYMFSASMPPLFIAAILSMIELQLESPELIEKLRKNSQLVIEGIRDVVRFASKPKIGIIVIRIPEKSSILKLNEEFNERNIFVNSISYPAVPINEQRFRISVMATHTDKDIGHLVKAINDIWKKHDLIPKWTSKMT